MAKGTAKIDGLIKALNRTKKLENKKFKSKITLTIDLENSKDIELLREMFPGALERAHLKTLELIRDDLEIALGLAMESKTWQWDYGDGDIVDTGALRDSADVRVTKDGFSIAYGEQYAGIVYYGGYINPYGNPNVQIYMPGRPWVSAVLNGGNGIEKFDFDTLYKSHIESILEAEFKAAGIL